METELLILEDDVVLARSLARRLREHGTVHVAGSLAEAEAMLPTFNQLNVALVDWMLPDGMSGRFLERLRARQVPCLVITGLLDRDVVNAAQAVGCEIAIKPVDAVRVEEFVLRVVSRGMAVERSLDEYVRKWGLTRRHRDILARGIYIDTRVELANALGVTEATIKAHIRAMRRRTRAENFGAMVREVLVRALRITRSSI